MQRVLSFQMARGLGESSEFVTKRMCFSFLFSVGFLCLLCGFLLGRFATQRAMEFRAEKKRMELAGNGLESTEYLQQSLLQQLERAPLDPDFEMNWVSPNFKDNDVRRANAVFRNLPLIRRVLEYESCVIATVRGTREPDRYVVLSASGEGVGIALELAKILNNIHREHGWKPRRSLIFCLFSEPSNACPETLPGYTHHNIMAYIAMNLKGTGPFVISGSDVVQSAILENVKSIKNLYSYNEQSLPSVNIFYNVSAVDSSLDIPHASVSFIGNNAAFNKNIHEREVRKIVLAQILGQTVWRLSECLIMRWNPNYFNNTVSRALESLNATEFGEIKEKIHETSVRLLTNVKTLNGRIDTVDIINTLDTRILNDLLIDLDRVLLCYDKKLHSRTNWPEFLRLSHEPFNIILTYLKNIVKCYETAIQLLEER